MVIKMTINNCDSQSPLHKQEIYSSQWLILCVMMHVTYNIMFTATDLASKSKSKLLEIFSNGKIASSSNR